MNGEIMKKKISILFCLVIPIFLITSCIEVQYTIKINDDNSQRIGVKIIMPGMFSVQSGDIIKKLNEEGYSVSTKSEGDKFIVEGTKTTVKGAWLFPFPSMAQNVNFEPSVKNFLFFKLFTFNGKYTFENKEAPDPNNPFASMAIPLKYFIEMPGSIDSHNANQFNGNTLQWQYNMADRRINVDIQATSYTVNYIAIVIFAVIMFVLIAVMILLPAFRKYAVTISLAILIALPALIYFINVNDKISTSTPIESQKPGQTQSSGATVPAAPTTSQSSGSASPAPAPAPNPANNIEQSQKSASQSQMTWTPSFDCAKASTGPERLICSNRELAEADVKMAQLYRAALNRVNNKETLIREQKAWMQNERDACSDVSCMLKAYNNRMLTLSK
jgi:uncharacterized protein YecT (DUF1311 family)